jgi:hypothetical protein
MLLAGCNLHCIPGRSFLERRVRPPENGRMRSQGNRVGLVQGAALALLFTFAAGPRLAAAPPNDAFAQRTPLSGLSGEASGSTEGATREPSEPIHADNPGGKSAWWTWTPGQRGTATITTLSSGFDTLLAVYTGSAIGTLRRVDENDDLAEFELRSAVTFAVEAGTACQIAVDGYDGDSGPVGLIWHLEPAGQARPPNDLFANRTRLDGSAGAVIESSVNAGKEAGEPAHAGEAGGRSLWWSWVAPEDGTAAFGTGGSSFDTVLAVYSGGALRALAVLGSDDDGGEGVWSAVDVDVSAGTEYQIAVDGFGGESGLAVLRWSFAPPCVSPTTPADPSPGDMAAGLPLAVTLRWNAPPSPARKVVYGADDRLDLHEVEDPAVVEAWESTVAIVSVADLTDEGDDTYSLPGAPLSSAYPLCSSERFLDQPVPAYCSGFLVAPDLVATAGHCVTGLPDCSAAAFVFGFRMLGPGRPVLRFPKSQVYFCSGVAALHEGDDTEDWAVVRLDREVPDHRPLPIRRSGKVAGSRPLLVIGHPLGLPAKVAGGARVRENAEPGFFRANLDTYIGNSGSAVLDAETLLVEGVLVSGEEDFVESNGCLLTKKCQDTGCAGEAVTRSTEFDHAVPADSTDVSFEVRFGPCESLARLGETSGTTMEVGSLEPATTYCWQVIAESGCGKAPGPVWSFTTGAGAPTLRRGDASRNGTVDISDAILVLNFLFLGGTPPPCEKSADADDDGRLNLTDPVYVLNHLFQGGPPPAEPQGACGPDPTADTLACAAAEPCV